MAGKSLFDYMSTDDYNRYNELIAKATEAKANAPKAPRTKKPLTVEQKRARAMKNLEAAQAKLDALLAAED